MQPLTPNFVVEEFELDGPMPDACVPMYTVLCHNLLEVIRNQFLGKPVIITSGYRTPDSNAEAHGVANSQHVATAEYCAADFYIVSESMKPVFDWVRSQTNLVWDQMILEHGTERDIIHLSVTRGTNRRQALEGDTANKSAYSPWAVAQYSVNA